MIAVFAPRALRDLETIAEYLAERSRSGAANVMIAIKASIDALVAFPEINRPSIARATGVSRSCDFPM